MERACLPVDFAALPAAIEAIAEREPGALLLLGEAPSRELRLEGVALNLIDTVRPDNAGRAPLGVAVLPGAPLALPARWDPNGAAARLRAAGIRAAPSFHAGTFACNAALFLALHRLPTHLPVGFMHLPRRGWPFGPSDGMVRRGVLGALELLMERGALH